MTSAARRPNFAMTFKISGLDKLQRTLTEAMKAAEELDGHLAEVRFDPADPSSVEAAIAEAHSVVDAKLGGWYGNPVVDQLAAGAKASFEAQILSKAEESNMVRDPNFGEAGSANDILKQIRDTISDLRRADYQTFDRHASRLARLLDSDALKEITISLTKGLDIQSWIDRGEASQGSMVGSAKLEWPSELEAQLGISILLARRFAGDSRKALDFAHTFYYNGNKITSNLQHMVSQVFIPFERDFSSYVTKKIGAGSVGKSLADTKKYPRRVFIVHGHDDEVRETISEFLKSLDFEVIILHEQANRGRTIIEKFEEHADVGFAVVLFTPDDVGSANGGELASRARQNVVLELGYFLGKLGRERVLALKRGDIELPSDFLGVVYTPFDAADRWKRLLARELAAAEYEIDWRLVPRG